MLGGQMPSTSPRRQDQHDAKRPCALILWNEMTPYRRHILQRMAAELHDLRVVNFFTHSITDNSMPWQVSVPEGVEVCFDPGRCLRLGRFFSRGWRAVLRSVEDALDAHRPDVVIFAGHGDIVRLLAIRSCRRRGIPVVHYSDANIFGITTSNTAPRDAIRLAYLRWVLRLFDGYLTMGFCGKAYYGIVGDRRKPMFLHPYEPDYSAIQRRDEAGIEELAGRLGLASGRLRFLYSGRLVSRKRVDVLIDAFSSIAQEIPSWDLLIVGGGPLQAELEARVPSEIRERVAFTGFLQMAEVSRCYHLSHALVHPSGREAWGLIINEAAAAGLPIVATYVTGAAAELVRHRINGYVVAPGSVAELAAGMRFVAEHPDRSRLGAASLRMLEEWRTSADPIQGIRDVVLHFRRS